jgi:hypothetical protein
MTATNIIPHQIVTGNSNTNITLELPNTRYVLTNSKSKVKMVTIRLKIK